MIDWIIKVVVWSTTSFQKDSRHSRSTKRHLVQSSVFKISAGADPFVQLSLQCEEGEGWHNWKHAKIARVSRTYSSRLNYIVQPLERLSDRHGGVDNQPAS